MRIVWISLGTLLFGGMILLTIRFWGMGQTESQFENNFIDPKPLMIFQPSSYEEAIILSQQNPELALYFETKLDNGQLKIFDQVAETFLKNWDQTKKIISINIDVQNIHNIASEQLNFLDSPTAKDEFLIQSDYALVIENLKKLNPMWTFGTSRADILKLNSFLSLWIEPACPLKGDIYISPFSIRNRPVLSDGVIKELKRRKKQIIIGPVETQTQAAQLKSWNVDGYIINNLDHLNWF